MNSFDQQAFECAIHSVIEVDNLAINQLYLLDTVDSTNRFLMERGVPGDVCIAEQQSAGRGRSNKVWHSPRQGNIYLSLVLGFDAPPKRFSFMALYVSIAICEVLERYGIQGVGIKWPNDILWRYKKLAGILLESRPGQCEVVVGLGLNLAMERREGNRIDQPWCSLSEIVQQQSLPMPTREELVAHLVGAIFAIVKKIEQKDAEAFDILWQRYSLLEGRTIEITHGDVVLQGQVMGLDANGRLMMTDISGQQYCFSVGEIKVLGYIS